MYETEQEQIEAIKGWFARWGNYIIAGVLAVIIGSGGAWFYQDQQQKTREAASDRYQQVLRVVGNEPSLSAGERAELDQHFTVMLDEYPDTTYTLYTALLQARYAAVDGDYDTALERLNWALESTDSLVMSRAINLRLARVMFAQENYEGALAQLESIEPGSQRVGYDELRGDIHSAMGDREQARQAYGAAWEAAQARGMNRPLLQVKAENYGVL